MRQGRKWSGLSLIAGMAATTGLIAPAAQAQDVPAVNTGAITLEAGADVVTEYWFRGIGQQNEGFIFQPFVTIGVELPEVAGIAPQFYASTQNSFHDRGDTWYESDFIFGVAAEIGHGFSADFAYIHYAFPEANNVESVNELALGVAYDDSELMEAYGLFGLNPHALLAFEIDNQRTGTSRGTYLELGIEPTFDLIPEGDFPVTLSVPAVVGLNLNNYYQDPQGGDSTFGYFDLGFRAGVPLRFIPREYGDWSASAGVHLLWLGRSNRRISEVMGTGDDTFNTYGTVGFSMSY